MLLPHGGRLAYVPKRILERSLPYHFGAAVPDVGDGSVPFPPEIYVAYAVCTTECGARASIVVGSTQVYEQCGKGMFRTAVRRYMLCDDPGAVESADKL